MTAKESFGSSLTMDDSNRRLYSANRGNNDIAIFNIIEGGTLVMKNPYLALVIGRDILNVLIRVKFLP